MESPHALLQLLRQIRAEHGELPGALQVGEAYREVLDSLIDRAQALADRYPQGQPMTMTLIEGMDHLADELGAIGRVMDEMAELVDEAHESVAARQVPLVTFMRRIEGDGYDVSDELQVADGRDWGWLQRIPDPALAVELEAERVARTAQAVVHQERVHRMATEFDAAVRFYAERMRDLIEPR